MSSLDKHRSEQLKPFYALLGTESPLQFYARLRTLPGCADVPQAQLETLVLLFYRDEKGRHPEPRT